MARRALQISLLALVAAAPATPQSAEEWEIERLRWNGPAATATAIELRNPYGDVRCRQAPGEELSITAVVQRHEQDPYRAELEVTPGEVVRVEALFRASEEAAGGEYVEGMERRRVDLMVLVPEGPRLEITTDGGLLEAKGLANDVRAETAGGNVVLSNYGSAAATSERGTLDVTFRSADWGEAARLETRTGAITVWLPTDADAVVEAETEGILSTDYSVEITRDAGGRRKRARAVVGNGKRHLTASSVKGDIRLFRLPG